MFLDYKYGLLLFPTDKLVKCSLYWFVFVCLSACLCARLYRKEAMACSEICREGNKYNKEEPIKFWDHSD